MAITAAGLYGLSIEKMMIDTLGQSLEAETHLEVLVTDTYAPNFDTHDFHLDLTNEITGGNYAAEAVTTTEITIATGTLTYDAADTVYDNGGLNNVTIASAMAGIVHTNVGTSATNQLIVLQDFVTAASSTASTFTIQHSATGIFTLDFTP